MGRERILLSPRIPSKLIFMQIDLQKFPRMGDHITQQLFTIFEARQITMRFVGGCVRDAILGIPAHDIDMAVPIGPDETIDILTEANIKVIPTGYEFGTVTAVLNGREFQITSLRQDWETDGRYASVTYGQDWKADASRRDFTMNALYAGIDGAVFDYFDGIKDLKSGHVRFIGDAHTRIREDYLRILRYFRFLAWYGHGTTDQKAIEACQELIPGLQGLSRERIGHEFMKLLTAPSPLLSLTLLNEMSLSSYIFDLSMNLKALEYLLNFERKPKAIRRLAALCLPKIDAARIAKSLRLSSSQKKYLQQCQDRLPFYPSYSPSIEKTYNRNLYLDGAEHFIDFTLLGQALKPRDTTSIMLEKARKAAASWKAPTFPLKGQDLLDLGMQADRQIGILLKSCEDWWVDHDFQPNREACLQWVQVREEACERV
jgi:poly(A) polymerase